MSSERTYLDVDEFAARMGVTRDAVYKWITRSNFPHIRVSPRRIKIPSDAMEIAHALQQQERDPHGAAREARRRS